MAPPYGIAVKRPRDSLDRQLGFLARHEGVSDSAVAPEELHLVQPRRGENVSNSRMAFRGDAMPFPIAGSCVNYAEVGKPRPAFSLVMDPNDKGGGRLFSAQEAALRYNMHVSQSRMGRDSGNSRNLGWNVDGNADSVSGGDGSDGDEHEDEREDEREDADAVDDDERADADAVDDDELDDGDGEVDGLSTVDMVNVNKNSNTSTGSVQSSSEKISCDKPNVEEHLSCFGLSRTIMAKCGNAMRANSGEQHHRFEGGDNHENAITVVEPVSYRSQISHGGDGANTPQKAVERDTVYSSCSKRQDSFSAYPGESVRAHLSDPVTGILMDDAMILPCGHSFGVGGMQHVQQAKACFKCSLPFSEDSVRPNLALRAAVQAFLREEESHSSRISKRRRNRFELDRYAYDDQLPMDSRSRGVQFPFNLSDRVIIKGNKRTPERFVGRIAVVTTQCLNGWYVVKTLDNAESVKLQYRSLEKVADDSSNFIGNKTISSIWL